MLVMETGGSLIGQDIVALKQTANVFREGDKEGRGVGFGLDTVYTDLAARQCQQSVAEFLVGALVDAVDDYFSISERSVEKIRQRMCVAGPDRAVIQLKLGIGNIENDAMQIVAALQAMGENQLLLADVNGGWTVDAACEIIGQFENSRLMWEEPCSTYNENIQVAGRTGRPVMFDQCVGDTAQARRAVEGGVAAAVCIKPAFLGGLDVARDIRDLCARTGMKMRIDGPWCGDIASAAILHLAVGAPAELLIAGCDLREPLVIERCLQGVRCEGNARISPPRGHGLGIDANGTILGEPDLIFD